MAVLALVAAQACANASNYAARVEAPWESFELEQRAAEEILDRGGRYHELNDREVQIARLHGGEILVRGVERDHGTKVQASVAVNAQGAVTDITLEELRVRVGRRGAMTRWVSLPDERFDMSRFHGVTLEDVRARLDLNEDWTFIPFEYRRYSKVHEKIRGIIIEALVVSRELRAGR